MAERVPQLRKQTWFPQPHDVSGGCTFEFDDATLDSTIVPIAFYDEGMGAPSAQETNPENAAFAVPTDKVNCFVGSTINQVSVEFRFNLTSKFFDDNLAGLRFATMPIHMAFINDYTAIDELTNVEVQDILEMQTETTDNQGGPLYVAGTDLPEKVSGSAVFDSNTPFLDTDAGLEAVAFDINGYYDALQFLTIREKLMKTSSGLQWHVLNANRPNMKYRLHIKPNVKAMNLHTYFGLLLHCPIQGTIEQIGVVTRDITAATQYMDCDWIIRYNEWNPEYNMSKV